MIFQIDKYQHNFHFVMPIDQWFKIIKILNKISFLYLRKLEIRVSRIYAGLLKFNFKNSKNY